MTLQKEIQISSKDRGFHLITDEIIERSPELNTIKECMLNIFIKHTSASLTINEAADPTVRSDFEAHFNEMVPEHQPYFKHTMEGPDDMPAHLKTLITNTNLTMSVDSKKLILGFWQGIYLCEFRNQASGRHLIITIYS